MIRHIKELLWLTLISALGIFLFVAASDQVGWWSCLGLPVLFVNGYGMAALADEWWPRNQ